MTEENPPELNTERISPSVRGAVVMMSWLATIFVMMQELQPVHFSSEKSSSYMISLANIIQSKPDQKSERSEVNWPTMILGRLIIIFLLLGVVCVGGLIFLNIFYAVFKILSSKFRKEKNVNTEKETESNQADDDNLIVEKQINS